MDLKADLTRKFEYYRKEYLRRARQIRRQGQKEWQQARLEGKIERRELTDQIQKLVIFAQEQGSKSAHTYYTTFTRMICKLLFNLKKLPKNFRDSLDKDSLRQLQLVEWKASQWIDEAMANCDDYHKPYFEVKDKMESLVSIIGQINLSQKQLA